MLHPFLFALAPVLFLFAHNVDQVVAADTVLSAAIMLTIAAIIFLFFFVIYRTTRKAAIAASLFLLLFFAYANLFALKEEFGIRQRYLFAGFFVPLGMGLWFLWITSRPLQTATRFFTTFAALFLLLSLVPIGTFTARRFFAERGTSEQQQIVAGTAGDLKPDIYYFLVDGYASQWELKQFYGNDNSEFINHLTEKGFYVVPESRSNYAKTEFSLPTILNFDYLEALSAGGVVSAETTNTDRLLQDHAVGRFLKSQGYTYLHFGSWWDATYKNRYADINVNKGYMPEFPQILYKSIEPFLPWKPAFLDVRRLQWERAQYQFDELAKVPARKEPTFTFVHFITHSPFVFNQDGSFVETEARTITEEGRAQYLGQLLFLNQKLTALIDTILAESVTPPIMVIQSDHGSRDTLDELVTDTRDFSDEYLLRRLRNFSTFYAPEANAFWYDTITPVNTFRVILNAYFGTSYNILPDKNFITLPGRHYEVMDVTDRVVYD